MKRRMSGRLRRRRPFFRTAVHIANSFGSRSRKALRSKLRQYGAKNRREIKRASPGNSSFVALDTTGFEFELTSQIVQGITSNNRIGDRANLKDLNIRLAFHDTNVQSPDFVRIMLIWGNGTQPTKAGMVSAGFTATEYGQMTPWRRVPTSDDLNLSANCIYDRCFTILSPDAAEGIQPIKHINIHVPLGRSSQWAVDDVTLSADKGYLYWYMVCSHAATSTVTFAYQVDLYFTDPM